MSETSTQKATLVGGAIAAFAASLCCLGPLLLVTLGVSGAWISSLAALEPYRPVFIGGALVLMGLAWRRIYHVPAAGACEPGAVGALPQTNRVYKIMFWLVSALVLLALAFPLIVPFFY